MRSHLHNRIRRVLPLRLTLLETRLTPAGQFVGPHTTAEMLQLAATGADIWQPQSALPAAVPGSKAVLDLAQFTPIRLDFPALKNVLGQAPRERTPAGKSRQLELALPTPNGTFSRFNVFEYSMMEPGLAAQFPTFRTYMGQGIDDPNATVAIDITSLGFGAQVLSPRGTWYIDPFWLNQTEEYASYYGNELKGGHGPGCTCPLCTASALTRAPKPNGTVGPTLQFLNGDKLHDYRLAVAATSKYTVLFDDTVDTAFAKITKAVDRVNQVYRSELSVQFTLVANEKSLIFVDGVNDPYTSGDTGKMINENQTNVNMVIGSGNYDVAQVFDGTDSGGLANIGVVGNDSKKAQGCSTSNTAIDDTFFTRVFAHEMGHQFGAHHVFNSAAPGIVGQRYGPTAVEPGSGSTIMSYAGGNGSGADNLQDNVDPYFNVVSLEEITNYIATIPTIGTTTLTGNALNGVGYPPHAVIPRLTPFYLSIYANDSNGFPLTYTIEETDVGPATNLVTPDNGASPLFRSQPPSASGTRYFPRLDQLAGIVNLPGEYDVNVPRTLHFKGTARNSRATGGAIITTPDMLVDVVDNGSSRFRLTFGDTSGITWPGKSQQTITWDVAGTNANGINCSSVAITMSTDGGLTYPIALSANTPNDGNELVTIPNLDTTTARFKVEGLSSDPMVIHPFFQINTKDMAIYKTPSVWTGADTIAPGEWTSVKNWSNGVPGPGDTAVFQAGAKSNPIINSPVSIGGVQFQSTWTGILNINAPLTLTGASQWDAGNISINSGGSVTNTGTATLNNSGQDRISGIGIWTNKGTMIQTGKGDLAIDNTAILDTPVGGIYDLQSDAYIDYDGSSQGKFTCEGTLRRSPGVGTTTGYITCIVVLTGTIDVQSTTLSVGDAFRTASVSDIAMKVASGAKLNLANTGTVNCSGQLSGQGAGAVQLAGGTLKLAGDTSLNFVGQTFQCSNTSYIDLNGKTLTNKVDATVNVVGASSILNIQGGGTFTNNGNVVQSGSSSIYVNGTSTTFDNAVQGTYDIQTTASTASTYQSTSGTFTNEGVIVRSVATGLTRIEANFVISGYISVRSGTLALANFTSSAGTVMDVFATVDKSATLDLTGSRTVNYKGVLTIAEGANGPGLAKLAGGQINIIANATWNLPDNMFQWTDGTISVPAGVTLANASNSFMILNNPGNPDTLAGGGTLSNAGTIRQINVRNLNINGAGTLVDNTVTGTYDIQSTGGINFGGTAGTFTNANVFRKSVGTGIATVASKFTNVGGLVDVQAGTLVMPGTFDLSKGTLQGVGTLQAPTINADGVVRPGNSPGKLTVAGNYAQSGAGSLAIELNGTTVGSQYDQLAVDGTVALGGKLSVTLSYAAKINDTFIIIANDGTSDAVTGSFNNLTEGATLKVNGATMQISYKGGDGNDMQLKVISPPTPPRVTGIQLNDGSAQRSRITSLQVAFDQPVSLPAMPETAFELKRQGDNAIVALAPTVDNSGAGTIVTFSFTGGPVDANSLADGRYTLTAIASKISTIGGALDGDGNGTGGDDYVLMGTPANGLFRLFGDSDGNGTINSADFSAFRSAFGSSTNMFDFDNNGSVGTLDFLAFRSRFGASV